MCEVGRSRTKHFLQSKSLLKSWNESCKLTTRSWQDCVCSKTCGDCHCLRDGNQKLCWFADSTNGSCGRGNFLCHQKLEYQPWCQVQLWNLKSMFMKCIRCWCFYVYPLPLGIVFNLDLDACFREITESERMIVQLVFWTTMRREGCTETTSSESTYQCDLRRSCHLSTTVSLKSCQSEWTLLHVFLPSIWCFCKSPIVNHVLHISSSID